MNNNSFPEIDLLEIPFAKGYTYILECAGGHFYTGSTDNIRRRIEQHSKGEGARFTANHLPVRLVYSETYDRIDRAFDRGKQIQRWSRAKKIALIQGDMEQLKSRAKSGARQARPPGN